MKTNPLHYQLPSGRILLFTEPLTEAELEEFQQPESIAIFERIADRIVAGRESRAISMDSPEGQQLLKQFDL